MKAPSEIFMYFDLIYPDGYIAKAYTEDVEDQGEWTFNRIGTSNYMTMEHSNPESIDGKIVNVHITRKMMVKKGRTKNLLWEL